MHVYTFTNDCQLILATQQDHLRSEGEVQRSCGYIYIKKVLGWPSFAVFALRMMLADKCSLQGKNMKETNKSLFVNSQICTLVMSFAYAGIPATFANAHKSLISFYKGWKVHLGINISIWHIIHWMGSCFVFAALLLNHTLQARLSDKPSNFALTMHDNKYIWYK